MGTPYRYIAFLRAVNVGGRVVKMDRLRQIFEGLGFEDVATFIASGNVAFLTKTTDTRALERRIEKALRSALGYDVETFIRTPAELAAALRHDPFADGAESLSLQIGFLAEAPNADACRMVAESGTDVDDLRVHGREVYWRCHSRISETKLKPKGLDRTLGALSTMRNVTTIGKLVARYGDPPPAKG